MQANSESGTIDITERKLFEVFASIEGPGKKNSKTDYYKAVISQLPQNCQLEIGENVSLNSAIRKYKRKKDSRCSLSVLIEEASSEVFLSVAAVEESYQDETSVPLDEKPPSHISPSLVNGSNTALSYERNASADQQVPTISEQSPCNERSPPTKKAKNSFTSTFSKSYKDFNDLQDRQKKNITKPLLAVLENFINLNNFTISMTDLLQYLTTIVKDKPNSTVPSFSNLEAVCLMHCKVLSKEQMRQMRYFLSQKEVEFPTTNNILPIRQSLRPPTFPILDKKGRGLDIIELVKQTAVSVIKVIEEDNPKKATENLTFILKDGGDGAGTMPRLKSKKKKPEGENSEDEKENDPSVIEEEEAEHMFQYGIIPLKLIHDDGGHQDILWQNKVPNSARSLRPIYLIREKETNTELLDLVIKNTDTARNELNSNGFSVQYKGNTYNISCIMRDTMKDLKFKKVFLV